MRKGALLVIVLGLFSVAFGGERTARRLENGLLVRIVEPEQVLRLEQPSFVSTALAQAIMGEFEPVIGVAAGDDAKAYSTWLMEGYSVINDRLGKRPIVVTWSPFSFSSTVWDRVVDGDTLYFEDSGELWNDAVVLVDRQTGSRWSQIQGRALDGPMKGKTLTAVNSTYTKWGKWRSLYPQTVCLTKLGREIEESDFLGYYARTDQLGPANSDNPDSRLVGKELICGFSYRGCPVAVPLYALVENRQFPLVVEGDPLEVEFDQLAETAVVFSRLMDGDTLSLVRLDFGKGESYLKEKSSGTTWVTYSGRGVSGPMADRSLLQVPSTLCYWWVWVLHYPTTQLWEQPGTKPQP